METPAIKKEPIHHQLVSKLSVNSLPALTMTSAYIKQESGTAFNSNLYKVSNPMLQRLPSIKPQRDLTLGGRGGAATSKKVFTPNLNVVRNKNLNVKTSKDFTASRGRGRKKPERGGRSSVGGNVIQTTSIFSEGAGIERLQKSYSGSGGGSSSRSAVEDVASVMRKPIIIKKEKLDLKEESEYIREVLGDSDGDDYVEEKSNMDKLPIKMSNDIFKKMKVEIKKENENDGAAKKSYKVVSAPTIDDENTLAIANKLQTMHVEQQEIEQSVAKSPRYAKTIQELFNYPEMPMFLVQMPQLLPCVDEITSAPDESSTSKSNISYKPAKRIRNSLGDMQEGIIGKLIRYKSGKTKMIFGETEFNVEMGLEPNFVQEIMSLNANATERSGNMINLGPLCGKMTIAPDYDQFIKVVNKGE